MARIRLISNALLAELLERAHAAMEGTDLLMVSRRCACGGTSLQPLPWGGAQSRRTPSTHLVDPPVLHLISPQVLPRPADWKASASLTGFCFLEHRSADGAPSSPPPYSSGRELRTFLESGPAPFHAGFGSMISRDPEALAPAVVEAAQQAGFRLILSPGWGLVVPRAAVALDPVVAPAAGLPCGDWLC